jgi:hypothetical protein
MSKVTVDVVEDQQPFCVLNTGDGGVTLTKEEAVQAWEALGEKLGYITYTDESGSPTQWHWNGTWRYL